MREDLKEIAEELDEDIKEESKLMKLFKRSYIIVLSLIMVFLLLANTNMGYHLVSLFSGRIVSSTLNSDYSFDLKLGGKAYFEKEVYDRLLQMYNDNQKHEFKACLLGNKKDKDYFITGIYVPLIFKQEVYSVTSEMCNTSTIISLHSHPPLRCIFSEQDIISYNRFKERNKDGIIGLMCGEERISFFGYENG